MRPLFKALGILGTAALALAACGGGGGPAASATPRLIAGGIHVGSVKDAGYNEAQHDALVYMTQRVQGVKLLEAENVPEGPDSERVMENMIRQGAKLIFPQSFGYQDFALNEAGKHPDVKFEHPAGYKHADNFGTYWAASDQLSYALGVAAGKMTKTGKLGFIAGFPIPQIIYSVNAFHLGAQSVNPSVTTRFISDGTWSDPGKEAAATNALADQGVDVVTMIVDSPITVVQTAEKRGIYSIGYHSAAVQKFAPKGWISGVNFNFGPLFVKFANDVLNGTWKAQFVIGDTKSGMASLAPFGSGVPADVKNQVNQTVTDLQNGKNYLAGPVYDQAGNLRIPPNSPPDPNLVNTVKWFAQGIIGQLG